MEYFGHSFKELSFKDNDNVIPFVCKNCQCYCYQLSDDLLKIFFMAYITTKKNVLHLSNDQQLVLTCSEMLIKNIIE